MCGWGQCGTCLNDPAALDILCCLVHVLLHMEAVQALILHSHNIRPAQWHTHTPHTHAAGAAVVAFISKRLTYTYNPSIHCMASNHLVGTCRSSTALLTAIPPPNCTQYRQPTRTLQARGLQHAVPTVCVIAAFVEALGQRHKALCNFELSAGMRRLPTLLSSPRAAHAAVSQARS